MAIFQLQSTYYNCNLPFGQLQIKTSNFKNSPKSLVVHLKSKKHNMTEDEIKGTGMPNQEGDIMKFTKTIYLPPQTVKTKIAKLVSISNIAPNKIAKDDEIRELIAAKYPNQKIPCSPDTVKKLF